MEAKVNFVVVGAFVLVLSTAMIAGVLWLTSGKYYRKSYDIYQTYMTESVSGLNVNAPGQSITLSITLTDLEDKYHTNSITGDDEWINGSITIGWWPDMSQWGCLNGIYTFTTTALNPIHWAPYDYCPSSGVVQVNNAKIEFGMPSGYYVTVTLQPSGPSEVFADCYSMGGGMCSY